MLNRAILKFVDSRNLLAPYEPKHNRRDRSYSIKRCCRTINKHDTTFKYCIRQCDTAHRLSWSARTATPDVSFHYRLPRLWQAKSYCSYLYSTYLNSTYRRLLHPRKVLSLISSNSSKFPRFELKLSLDNNSS